MHSWFIDTDIELDHADRPHPRVNLEPLFINTPNSWSKRPDAVTAIPNLTLASDYVQTQTDLACMEAANEAARRAVNAILEATGSDADRCRLWKMGMPKALGAVPLMAKTLRSAKCGLRRIALIVARPSNRGMIMSSRIRSGRSCELR